MDESRSAARRAMMAHTPASLHRSGHARGDRGSSLLAVITVAGPIDHTSAPRLLTSTMRVEDLADHLASPVVLPLMQLHQRQTEQFGGSARTRQRRSPSGGTCRFPSGRHGTLTRESTGKVDHAGLS
ncbi:hypothetical protein [Planobispora takensis]|uniref:hypothetical protein n=1 Tax=Planobispora takensis TaxID=1367882 RepID=UPI0019414835|nr:hypothetical protein [Planobispora takensis]